MFCYAKSLQLMAVPVPCGSWLFRSLSAHSGSVLFLCPAFLRDSVACRCLSMGCHSGSMQHVSKPFHFSARQCNSGSEQFTPFPSRCFSQLIQCDSPPTISSAYLFAAFPALSKSGLCKSHAERSLAIPRLSCASFRFSAANQNDAVPFPSGALLCLCVADYAISKRFNAVLAMPMLGQAKQIWLCNSLAADVRSMQFPCVARRIYAMPLLRGAAPCLRCPVLCRCKASPSRSHAVQCSSGLCYALSPPGFSMRYNAVALPSLALPQRI